MSDAYERYIESMRSEGLLDEAKGRGVHEQLRAAADAVQRRWEVPPSPSGYLPFNALDDFE